MRKILAQERAHLLRLQVISIVVTGGQDVCAEHDAALDLRPKPFFASPLVHVTQPWRPFSSKPVTNPIVSREIRRCFGRGDNVIDGNRVLRMRQINVDDLGAHFAISIDDVFDRTTHFGIQAVT